jgi:hypothetical protein
MKSLHLTRTYIPAGADRREMTVSTMIYVRVIRVRKTARLRMIRSLRPVPSAPFSRPRHKRPGTTIPIHYTLSRECAQFRLGKSSSTLPHATHRRHQRWWIIEIHCATHRTDSDKTNMLPGVCGKVSATVIVAVNVDALIECSRCSSD